ncbi:MAG: glutathione S-transferase family protein [Rhodospirillales bacterium]|jgi:glutathione S-transferase
MARATLYLGNKRYSSWSMRGWLACRLAGFAFDEVMIQLDTPATRETILAVSPSGRVPCLQRDGAVIWDSLAIAEHCAETARHLWPADPVARAHARAIVCEMHAGFVDLRRAMFFNVGQSFPGEGRTPGALADIARVCALWAGTRARFGSGGPFLFGADFTIADAFYAPVVCRFMTWQPELDAAARAYVAAVLGHPLVADWVEAGRAETWRSPRYEVARAP